MAAQKKELTEKEWMALLSKTAVAWCQRFRAAALAKAKSPGPAAGPADGPQASVLPAEFELQRGAKVIAAYHLAWPQQAPASLGPPKPGWLEVYYVCAEESQSAEASYQLL